ncbi:LuxR family transcriptional regulator [Salinibacterium metalliresistens]|jgi:quercetin dioxygenase-like cupin family protein|uniref:LuxR family transcriptional regulator n=1 Tax=Salinibacterium metalliresistens TaxID=3031321 RepID=UPI0030B82F5D
MTRDGNDTGTLRPAAVNLSPLNVAATDLVALQEKLLATARTAHAHRAADTVYGSRDTVLRQTILALLAGAELAAHDSPPEATLQVLTGRVRLIGDGRSWDLDAGALVPIPPERHAVTAIEDSVFLLTVIRATAAPTKGTPA